MSRGVVGVGDPWRPGAIAARCSAASLGSVVPARRRGRLFPQRQPDLGQQRDGRCRHRYRPRLRRVSIDTIHAAWSLSGATCGLGWCDTATPSPSIRPTVAPSTTGSRSRCRRQVWSGAGLAVALWEGSVTRLVRSAHVGRVVVVSKRVVTAAGESCCRGRSRWWGGSVP